MTTPATQPLVGISISDPQGLECLGFGPEHFTEMMITVARTVLRLAGGTTALVYGGDLRPGGFTRLLFDIALSERRPPTDARSKEDKEPPRRIYNYLAWPRYRTLTRYDEARMINACHFMRIHPSHAGFPEIGPMQSADTQLDPPAALVSSRCLTRMRELSTHGGHPTIEGTVAPPLLARIMLGGRVTGYSSFMPGLFEELLVSRETAQDLPEPVPVYVIGAFGGAAGQLAEALLSPDRRAPLTLEFQREQAGEEARAKLETLLADYAERPDLPQPDARYEALGDVVDTLATEINADGTKPLDNGLAPQENRRLLQSRDEIEIRRLIRKGLDFVLMQDRSRHPDRPASQTDRADPGEPAAD